ncbi:MAG TPA: transaldolase [Candidatus Paceibacterota bacterium]
MPRPLDELNIKIYADGAEKASILELYHQPFISGFTTNPTLMRKAGVTDYAGFAKEVLAEVKNKPISFEVFSDDFSEMERQAHIIDSWGDNVYVKIPITNTKGAPSLELIQKLAASGVKLNVTAILTIEQVKSVLPALRKDIPAIISVFAGRVADTGVDPIPLMEQSAKLLKPFPAYELLWASTRELFNIYQAEFAGAKIITVPADILKKTVQIGIDHHELSIQTVKMFYEDGQKVGYTLYES